ncbi:D-2-hydroxyacid dehydrogenase [Sporolactobacillus sp. THM19-2]|jgi:phosphoglycerate dehydrogenase-like enzyme|uniref:D-2-hydroxyacid dehydrogenase n=1 Tax=Sporolactobacillus sp. THM19-2 TaxID=2511171 RepID=UPI0010207F31|nr:D-2-hydroxyacid dehydrogenase [Sporolactobacillus sp. THM19-2]RYL86517.1 D-2-hydroxyacid dehydrogenase [Sporolactobacillus sp. THM19-2]
MKKIVFGFDDEFKLSNDVLQKVRTKYRSLFQFLTATNCNLAALNDAVAFIGWPSDDELKAMPRLQWLQLPSAGANHFARHPNLSEQVVLTNASGVFGVSGAEHIFSLLLAFTRNLADYIKQQEKQIWHVVPHALQLDGATVAIVGMGDIGIETAKRLHAFGSVVVGVRRTLSPKPDFVNRLYDMNGLDDALGQSDFVVNILPLTPETKLLFNRERFSHMKDGAVFINVGRGGTVDEPALIQSLTSGKLAGAGLDVTATEPLPDDSPLWKLSNVILTSHSLGVGPGKLKKRFDLILRNLEHFSKDEPLENVVNRKLGY